MVKLVGPPLYKIQIVSVLLLACTFHKRSDTDKSGTVLFADNEKATSNTHMTGLLSC
jgi:hypothetical protein